MGYSWCSSRLDLKYSPTINAVYVQTLMEYIGIRPPTDASFGKGSGVERRKSCSGSIALSSCIELTESCCQTRAIEPPRSVVQIQLAEYTSVGTPSAVKEHLTHGEEYMKDVALEVGGVLTEDPSCTERSGGRKQVARLLRVCVQPRHNPRLVRVVAELP